LGDARGGGRRGRDAEELILRTVAAHADSLLRTARRFSICPDDAQDAYQRALEIFMGHAERLDADRAAGWLHVVVKREAQAIRRSRQKLVASREVNLDAHEARSLPTPEERIAAFDLVGRSAEALQRLKPQEVRALWLRAQGHSYNDIGELTGWSYTKVNRCLTEGRRSFLKRYADIESGAECERWLPTISAMVDGEVSAEDLLEVRPHLRNCPGCRATLRALQGSSAPLSALMPVPLGAAATADGGEHVTSLFARAYELLSGGLHDRAMTSFTKVQAVVETTAVGKAAAIAGAAAAVAGGGYATVERGGAERPVKKDRVVVKKVVPTAKPGSARQIAPIRRVGVSASRKRFARTEFDPPGGSISRAPEFSGDPVGARSSQLSRASRSVPVSGTVASKSGPVAPEFNSNQPAREFAP